MVASHQPEGPSFIIIKLWVTIVDFDVVVVVVILHQFMTSIGPLIPHCPLIAAHVYDVLSDGRTTKDH